MNAESVSSNVDPATGAPILRLVLTGDMAARFGPLPVVPLPQDNEPLLGWIRDVADNTGILNGTLAGAVKGGVIGGVAKKTFIQPRRW